MLNELKSRSKLADEKIASLRAKIGQLKLTQGSSVAHPEVSRLQNENKTLREQVEKLKDQLVEIDTKKGTQTAVNGQTPKPVQQTQAAQPVEKAQPVKAAQPVKEAAKQQPAPAKGASSKKAAEEPVTNADVSKLDMRVGKIVKCEKHPDADALYVEQIDLGEDKPRNVCSGLVRFIPLDQMQDKMVVCLCNLKASKLRGVMSEAMVLCASTPEKVELLVPPEGAKVGDRVTVAGFEGEPAPELNTKNKIFDAVQPDLKTNDELVATYKGVPFEVKSVGVVKTSSLKSVPIK